MPAAADVAPAVGAIPLALLLALAAASGLFLSRLFRATQDAEVSSFSVSGSFPIVALALTAVFLTVQFSLPLSIGLLGALSLVRFRTPVKQPEEIAFLFLVIATSVTIGAYKLAFAGALLAAAAAVAFAHRLMFSRTTGWGGTLEVLLPGERNAAGMVLRGADGRPDYPLESLSSGEHGTRLTWRFSGDPEPLVRELRRQLAANAPEARINVFPNRESAL